MGSKHSAYCGCGFKTEVFVGGSRQGRDDSFPHYCKTCGIVNVNMTPRKNQKKSCPKCKSTDVALYGTHEMSAFIGENYTALQYYSYIAKEFGNYCPKCHKMTLVFDPIPSVIFD